MGDDVSRMREGVRARVAGMLAAAGPGLRRRSPSALLAVLCAGALAPVVVAGAGAGVVTLAVGGVIGSVGADLLATLVGEAIEEARQVDGPPDEAAVVAGLTAQIEEILAADGTVARSLRVEIAQVLAAVGAAQVALEAAVAQGDPVLRTEVAEAFVGLAADFDEFRDLLVDGLAALAAIDERLQREGAERRSGLDLTRDTLVEVRLLRDELVAAQAHRMPTTTVGRWGDRPPFRGLWPYDEEHGDVYFGRDRVTAQLVTRIGECLDGPSVVVVTGASGVGKSSLLRAGLVPALARGMLGVDGATGWPRLVMTPTTTPLDELTIRLAVVGGINASEVGAHLAERPGEAHQLVQRLLLERGDENDRLMLIVDQFEEAFAHQEADAFIEALVTAATRPCGPHRRPPAVLVLAVRGDHWDRCASHPRLAGLLQECQFVVEPMSETELRQTITGPAMLAGLDLDAGLADDILAELRPASGAARHLEASALPLLSQTMLIMWARRDGPRLTRKAYAMTGGVGRVVAASADGVFDDLTADQQDAARRLFTQLTVVTRDGTFARRRVRDEDLGNDTVIEAFIAQRLVVRDTDHVEISHDIVLEVWPRLREWLQADRDAFWGYSDLVDRSGTWIAADRDGSYLYRGAQLANARHLVARWQAAPDRYPPLDVDASEFLAASRRNEASRRGRIRAGVAVLAGLVVVGLLATALAVRSSSDAARQRTRALATDLLTRSKDLRTTDPCISMLLAAQSWQTVERPEARVEMLNALAQPGRCVLPGVPGSEAAAFSPDGKTLVTASDSGTVTLWDTTTNEPIGAPLPTSADTVEHIAFTSDGDRLVAITLDGEEGGGLRIVVHEWDLASRELIDRYSINSPFLMPHLAMSADGTRLAVGAGAHIENPRTTKLVYLWDLTRREEIGALRLNLPSLTHLAFSIDGRWLATYGETRDIDIWDTHNLQRTARIEHDASEAARSPLVAVSPDGRLAATGGPVEGSRSAVRIWNLVTSEQIGSATESVLPTREDITALAFSPDAGTVVIGGQGGTIRLLDVASQTPIGDPLRGHIGDVARVIVGGEGLWMASIGVDATVRMWDFEVARQNRSRPMVGPATAYWQPLVFSADGQMLVSVLAEEAVQVWDPSTGEPIGAPFARSDADDWRVNALAVSAGGLVATSHSEGPLRLWDLASRATVGEAEVPRDLVIRTLAFNADGSRLISGDVGGAVQFWDVESRLPIRRSAVHRGIVLDIASSPDGESAASVGQDAAITFWRGTQEDGQPLDLGVDLGATDPELLFSPDGRTLAFAEGTGETVVHLVDVARRVTQRSLVVPTTGGPTGMAFSPDGKILAISGSASGVGAVWLWDIEARQLIGSPRTGHTNILHSVTISPDGRTLAAVEDDKTIRLWDLAFPDDPITAVCAAVGRPLSRDDWEEHMPGKAYDPACR